MKKGECDHDTECSDDKACIEHSCRDPCKLSDLCGQGAICETSAHRPVCRCPEGWGGLPTTQCFQCKYKLLCLQNIFLYLMILIRINSNSIFW